MKCSKQIWNKFDRDQKIVWNKLYKLLNHDINFAIDKLNTKKQKKIMNDITSHNMACSIVWYFESLEKEDQKTLLKLISKIKEK